MPPPHCFTLKTNTNRVGTEIESREYGNTENIIIWGNGKTSSCSLTPLPAKAIKEGRGS